MKRRKILVLFSLVICFFCFKLEVKAKYENWGDDKEYFFDIEGNGYYPDNVSVYSICMTGGPLGIKCIAICENDETYDWYDSTFNPLNYCNIVKRVQVQRESGVIKGSNLKEQLVGFRDQLMGTQCVNDKCSNEFKTFCDANGSNQFCKDVNNSDIHDAVTENEDTKTCPTTQSIMDNNKVSSQFTMDITYIKNSTKAAKDSFNVVVKTFPFDWDSTSVNYNLPNSISFGASINVYFRSINEDSSDAFYEYLADKFKNMDNCVDLFTLCQSAERENDWYAEKGSNINCLEISDKYTLLQQTVGSNTDGKNGGIVINIDSEPSYAKGLFGNMLTTIYKCKDLMPEEILNIVRFVLNAIKVMVPVLLLGLGTLDFAKAVFAQDDGEIKKSQSKFIKRVIISVVIFLIPVLLGAILDIGNTLWPDYIDNTLCGIRENVSSASSNTETSSDTSNTDKDSSSGNK